MEEVYDTAPRDAPAAGDDPAPLVVVPQWLAAAWPIVNFAFLWLALPTMRQMLEGIPGSQALIVLAAAACLAFLYRSRRLDRIEIDASGMAWGHKGERFRHPWSRLRPLSIDPHTGIAHLTDDTGRSWPLPWAGLRDEDRERVRAHLDTHLSIVEHVEAVDGEPTDAAMEPLDLPWSTEGFTRGSIVTGAVVFIALLALGANLTMKMGGGFGLIGLLPAGLMLTRLLFTPLAVHEDGLHLMKWPWPRVRHIPWRDIRAVRGGSQYEPLLITTHEGKKHVQRLHLSRTEYLQLAATVESRRHVEVFE